MSHLDVSLEQFRFFLYLFDLFARIRKTFSSPFFSPLTPSHPFKTNFTRYILGSRVHVISFNFFFSIFWLLFLIILLAGPTGTGLRVKSLLYWFLCLKIFILLFQTQTIWEMRNSFLQTQQSNRRVLFYCFLICSLVRLTGRNVCYPILLRGDGLCKHTEEWIQLEHKKKWSYICRNITSLNASCRLCCFKDLIYSCSVQTQN